MITTVTIKTAEKPAVVRYNTQISSEDGKVQTYTNTTRVLDPCSEVTIAIYDKGSVSVNEEDENDF